MSDTGTVESLMEDNPDERSPLFSHHLSFQTTFPKPFPSNFHVNKLLIKDHPYFKMTFVKF